MIPHQIRMSSRNAALQEVQQNTTTIPPQSSNRVVHHASPQTPILEIPHSTYFPSVHLFVPQNSAIATEPTRSGTDDLLLNKITREKWAEFRTNPFLMSWDNPQDTEHEDYTPAGLSSPKTLQRMQYVCWQHGCVGRTFTTLSNYRRHCKERSWEYARPQCPLCGQQFLREAARDAHYYQQRCRVAGVDANGIPTWTAVQPDDALWKHWSCTLNGSGNLEEAHTARGALDASSLKDIGELPLSHDYRTQYTE